MRRPHALESDLRNIQTATEGFPVPTLAPGKSSTLTNPGSGKVDGVCEATEKPGIHRRNLLPYGPPRAVERVFSKIKHFFRKKPSRERAADSDGASSSAAVNSTQASTETTLRT